MHSTIDTMYVKKPHYPSPLILVLFVLPFEEAITSTWGASGILFTFILALFVCWTLDRSMSHSRCQENQIAALEAKGFMDIQRDFRTFSALDKNGEPVQFHLLQDAYHPDGYGTFYILPVR